MHDAAQDLGPDYFDRMNTGKQQPHHLRRLAELGCDMSQVTSAAWIASILRIPLRPLDTDETD